VAEATHVDYINAWVLPRCHVRAMDDVKNAGSLKE